MGTQTNNPFSSAPAGSSGDNSGGYGVSQTNGKGQSIPQIDPTKALEYYYQAGQDESSGIAAGNTAYQSALKTAATQIQQGYAEANNTLEPLSTASNQALTLFQQMLGITPASTTANFGPDLLQIDPQLTSIAGLINTANNTVDPTQRASLQSEISSQISDAGTGGVTAAQAALTNLGNTPAYTGATLEPQYKYTPEYTAEVNQEQQAYQQELKQYNVEKATDQTNLQNAQDLQGQLNTFNTQFNNTYTPTSPQGYTGTQVTQQLQNTPGYQFTLDQGDQQILRNQAAIGNLGTGNTQVALANYGQQVAQNTYQGYLGNLASIINAGNASTQQIAANEANQGGYLSNLSQLGGQAANNAATQEGMVQGAAQTQMGNASYNAAAFNTQLQYDAFALNAGTANQGQANATNLAAAAQNTNNQNESGAGFYQGMNAVVNNSIGDAGSTGSDSVDSNGGDV